MAQEYGHKEIEEIKEAYIEWVTENSLAALTGDWSLENVAGLSTFDLSALDTRGRDVSSSFNPSLEGIISRSDMRLNALEAKVATVGNPEIRKQVSKLLDEEAEVAGLATGSWKRYDLKAKVSKCAVWLYAFNALGIRSVFGSIYTIM